MISSKGNCSDGLTSWELGTPTPNAKRNGDLQGRPCHLILPLIFNLSFFSSFPFHPKWICYLSFSILYLSLFAYILLPLVIVPLLPFKFHFIISFPSLRSISIPPHYKFSPHLFHAFALFLTSYLYSYSFTLCLFPFYSSTSDQFSSYSISYKFSDALLLFTLPHKISHSQKLPTSSVFPPILLCCISFLSFNFLFKY